jgi:hypothetical protein
MAENSRKIADRLIDIASGKINPAALSSDRRNRRRIPFDATVAVVLMGPDDRIGRPMALQAKDISIGGMCVTSRKMLYPGSRGAMQLVRSNGQMAIVGVQVQHCRYAGEMQHHIGFKFIPLAANVDAKAFVGRNGQMIVLDTSLRAGTEE